MKLYMKLELNTIIMLISQTWKAETRRQHYVECNHHYRLYKPSF